ncbi:phosphoribosyltransferase [Legionella quateirensis]|uniref:Hypoxanthine phosphoribosyltransferase n=1 Tax=Legionella quateirensis TaxID=45072 RepID=A0A378KQU9_9GAMM|nr:phosphoribosyltransferase family protein [Legionella quateirensis]KTD54765.1 hypoxanthine-guanine phosphoribosyltransferase [Legionella quateirensis]STY16945.1 hypoxanthine phosphoribosyltransferase [Legionella quateirensis]
MIEEWLAELKKLDKFALGIAQRVWENSPEAKDFNDVPLTNENILIRVEQLADQIVKDFPDANPVIVGLMDGATPFASLLSTALNKRNYNFNYTTMIVSSYGHKLVSGELTMGALPKVKLYGKPVIVVDDVCDTGKTLKAIKDLFLTQYPEFVKLMVLVDKVQERVAGCSPDYIGFTMSPKAFIIGMGLDYLEELRNTSSIKTANPDFLPNEEELKILDRREFLQKQIEGYIAAQADAKQQISVSKSEQALTAPSSSISFFGGPTDENHDIIVPTNPSFAPGLSSTDSSSS